jgi:hypothetical protein
MATVAALPVPMIPATARLYQDDAFVDSDEFDDDANVRTNRTLDDACINWKIEEDVSACV